MNILRIQHGRLFGKEKYPTLVYTLPIMPRQTLYLDHAATAPLLPVALEKLLEAREVYGNTHSSHLIGHQAEALYKACQESIAQYFAVPASHVIFTSGGTESNNMAIWGALGGLSKAIGQLKDQHIITSKIEHDSIKKVLECLEHQGSKISWIGVDREGFLNLDLLAMALKDRTKLVTIHHGHNEMGAVQDLQKICALVQQTQPNPLVHVDAIHSFLKVPIDFAMGVDMISLSGHKFGAPKGVGALILGPRFKSREPKLYPFMFGADHQRGMRPGTIPVPEIASFCAALEWQRKHDESNREHVLSLRAKLIEDLPKIAVLNGPQDKNFVPNTINFSIPKLPSAMMVEALSAKGVCVSAGSACHSSNPKPNDTLLRMGLSRERALSAIRVSLSHQTSEDDIQFFSETLHAIVKKYLP